MIRSSRFGMAVVLLASVGVHALAAYVWAGNTEARIKGGAEGQVQAQLGNSFADMAIGTLTAEPADIIEPVETELAEQPVDAEVTEAVEPEELPEPEQPDIALPAEAVPLEPVPTAIAALAPQPELMQPVNEDQSMLSARPQTRPERVEKAAQAERARQELARKERAKREQAEKKRKKAKKKSQPKPKQQNQGNARKQAVAGSTSGSSQAKGKRQSTGSGKSSAAGNAAVSNYPGKVMARIARVSRPRVGSRGTAVVRFTVSGNGGLGSLSIARSSGSGALDQAALKIIRRAAPFPPPPAGAKRSFQISIKGR